MKRTNVRVCDDPKICKPKKDCEMKKEENIKKEVEAIDADEMADAFPSGEDMGVEAEDLTFPGIDGTDEEEEEEEGEQQEEPTHPTLKEVIEENAREDEKPFSSTLALKTILGGDILNTQAIRRQVWLILLITVFAIFYVSNRYSCQKQQIKIDNLNKELKKSKYKTLSLSSVLTERSRESHVVELIRATNDSVIHPSDQPPYIIMIPN